MTLFKALFVSLINFTGLFPSGVHCALSDDKMLSNSAVQRWRTQGSIMLPFWSEKTVMYINQGHMGLDMLMNRLYI